MSYRNRVEWPGGSEGPFEISDHHCKARSVIFFSCNIPPLLFCLFFGFVF